MEAIVYDLEGVYKIVSNSQMINGIWAASEPILTVDSAASDQAIYKALFDALSASKKNVLEAEVIPYKEFNKRLGLKKGIKVENVAKSFFVQLEESTLRFTPCSREKDGATKYYIEKDYDYVVVNRPEMNDSWRKLFTDVLRRCD